MKTQTRRGRTEASLGLQGSALVRQCPWEWPGREPPVSEQSKGRRLLGHERRGGELEDPPGVG